MTTQPYAYPLAQTTNINNISTNYTNQISVNQQPMNQKHRFSSGTAKKGGKKFVGGAGRMSDNPMANSSNLSMVLVMSNLV